MTVLNAGGASHAISGSAMKDRRQPEYLVEAAEIRQQRMAAIRCRVVQLHSDGLRNAQIATRLGVSQMTVKKILVLEGLETNGKRGQRIWV